MAPTILFTLALYITFSSAVMTPVPTTLCLSQSTDALSTELSLCGQPPFHTTQATVMETQLIEVPSTPIRLVLWKESAAAGPLTPYFAISRDGLTVDRVRPASYDLQLQFALVDPTGPSPIVAEGWTADPDSQVHIVQFVTQALP